MTQYDLFVCVTTAFNSLKLLKSHKSQDHSPFHDSPLITIFLSAAWKIKEKNASPSTQRKVYWDHWHTSSMRMMKVALCPCSMTSFPSEVRMCNPRGAFPGHFSILAMYFSLKPSVQLLDTILRYLGNRNKGHWAQSVGGKVPLFCFCFVPPH